MSSNRLRLLLVSMMAVFAISAVASASASAGCFKVSKPKTGNYEKISATGVCEGKKAESEYIKARLETKIKDGEWCAKVEEKETGTFATLKTCEEGTPEVPKGEYIRVMAETGPEEQFFTTGKCIEPNGLAEWWYTENKCKTVSPTKVGKWELEEPKLKGFTSKEEKSTLTAAGAKIECQKDTDTGKLVGRESVKEVVVTFKECDEPAKGPTECPVKSVGATHSNEIVTKSLKGELGEVAPGEATSEVGLLLEGEATNVFVTLQAPAGCFPKGLTEAAVEGSVVGEVTPLGLSKTDKVEFLLTGTGAQKIKTFERSFAKHCTGAPVARECKEDKSFAAKLSVFGSSEATFKSSDENEFEEALEVNKGS